MSTINFPIDNRNDTDSGNESTPPPDESTDTPSLDSQRSKEIVISQQSSHSKRLAPTTANDQDLCDIPLTPYNEVAQAGDLQQQSRPSRLYDHIT